MQIDFVELTALKALLGYNDIRTIRAWCGRNNVPIIILGRKHYVHQESINNFVEGQLSHYVDKNDIPENLMGAIRSSKLPVSINAIKDADANSKNKRVKQNKNTYSKASNDLLKAVYSAK
jgi:predicted thioredoxin/glutaredoxin